MSSNSPTFEAKVSWLAGIGVSTLSLLIQVFLYVVVPPSRKLDQKVLTHMTVARLANTIFEYLVINVGFVDTRQKDAIFALYLQTDAALICWMFVFTKNLYDKVVTVFTTKMNFLLVSLTIWLLTLPVGLLCPLLINMNLFEKFYDTYAIIKFIVLSLNLLFFCRIFCIALQRSAERDIKGLFRTLVMAAILVSITSLQVYLTDLSSIIWGKEPQLSITFCVINSFEAVAMTTLFVILVGGATEDSLAQTIKHKFRKMVV